MHLYIFLHRHTSELVENAKLNLDQPPFCIECRIQTRLYFVDSNQSVYFVSLFFYLLLAIECSSQITSNLQLNETIQYAVWHEHCYLKKKKK